MAHFLTDCAARKTDINIFEEDMHGANGNMTVSLVSVLYQCFTKTAPLVLQAKDCLCFASQELTVTLHIGRKLSVGEKYLMKRMPCVVQVTVGEQLGENHVLTQYLILLPFFFVF